MHSTALLTASFASSQEKPLCLNKGLGREKNHFLSFTLSTLSETSAELRERVVVIPPTLSLSVWFAFLHGDSYPKVL